MPDPAVKEKARQMFVENGLSMESILTTLSGEVSRKTLYNWRNEEDWIAQRKARFEKNLKLRDRLEALLERAIQEAEANLTAANLFAVGKAMEALRKAGYVDFSDEKAERDANLKQGFSKENLEKIEKQFNIL